MSANVISTPALRKLQTLFSQFERRSFEVSRDREARLGWSTEILGREANPVASWRELTPAEGKTLIDHLLGLLGQRETRAPKSVGSRSFRHAQKLGTEGRRDQIHKDTTIADGTEQVFGLIQRELTALGWDTERLRAFLASRSGPNNGRTVIRTLGEANRVHWALKRLAKAAAKQRAKEVAPA